MRTVTGQGLRDMPDDLLCCLALSRRGFLRWDGDCYMRWQVASATRHVTGPNRNHDVEPAGRANWPDQRGVIGWLRGLACRSGVRPAESRCTPVADR